MWNRDRVMLALGAAMAVVPTIAAGTPWYAAASIVVGTFLTFLARPSGVVQGPRAQELPPSPPPPPGV